jgi:hypothetical protein
MSYLYMLLPAFLMDIYGAPGAVVDMGSGILSTNRTLHSYLQGAIAASYQLILIANIETMINRTTKTMVS